MQIQPTVAAGAAAGNVSQAASRDRASAAGSSDNAATSATQTAVEKVARSEQSSADRDAYGAGPGLDAQHQDHSEESSKKQPTPHHESLPVRPPEPPSELDILG
ncbi:MAG: hypothetical protein IT423_19095 [Pirellulaceae bacterium]|nr:hypothetical protein [Pirellulaceae bacterium]